MQKLYHLANCMDKMEWRGVENQIFAPKKERKKKRNINLDTARVKLASNGTKYEKRNAKVILGYRNFNGVWGCMQANGVFSLCLSGHALRILSLAIKWHTKFPMFVKFEKKKWE